MDTENLTEVELNLLEVFTKLLKETGYLNTSIKVCPERNKDGSFKKVDSALHICKQDDSWLTFIYERGAIDECYKYNDMFSACLKVFSMIETKDRDYCLDVFPPLAYEIMKPKTKCKKL